MTSLHAAHLDQLQRQAHASDLSTLYLWPNTPIGDAIQERIREGVGVTDHQVKDRCARPARILRWVQRLVDNDLIPPAFSVLDIACGDAVILWHIKQHFPQAACYGLDCHKDEFPSHRVVQQVGVQLYRGFIQHLFAAACPRFDLVLMLNTYRGWEAAQLRQHEADLPQQADAWLQQHAQYVIVTAMPHQLVEWRRWGFHVKRLGPGEERSMMACCSKQQMPSLWKALTSALPREG